MAELREIVADEIAELEQRDEEVWEGVEEPRLQDWQSGLEIDLGPEGTRLRRYEAAADRLFRSAWTKLERLRKERGEPLMPRSAHDVRRRACHAAPARAAPPGSAASGPGAGEPLRARRFEVVAPRRSGGDGARLLGRRPAPARDQPRLFFPEQDEPDARPARERWTSRPAEKPAVASRN